MSEELTIDELRQKIKDSLDADIDKYVMPTKLELPTLSEYVREQVKISKMNVDDKKYKFTPTVAIKISSPFINKTEGTKNTAKFECTDVTHKTGKIYRVKAPFELSETWFGVDVPTKDRTKVGDLFELTKEPDAKKKLYRLTKINTKFPYTLQIRPNDFKRYFELVEGDETV